MAGWQQGLRERFNRFTDHFLGTKNAPSGASLPLPRKVPIRLEPKTFFANERTFLAWVGMATTLGGVSTGLVGFATEEQDRGGHRGPITPRTTQLITVLLLPLAVLMIVYGLVMFNARVEYLRRKQVGFFTDWVGPAVACALIMAALTTIMVVAFVDVFFYQYPQQ